MSGFDPKPKKAYKHDKDFVESYKTFEVKEDVIDVEPKEEKEEVKEEVKEEPKVEKKPEPKVEKKSEPKGQDLYGKGKLRRKRGFKGHN